MATENDKGITHKLLESLSTTRFACSSLERLGSYLGFVYRGHLRRALNTGAVTVIIKHNAGHAARMEEFQLPENRGSRESEILLAFAQTPNPVPPFTFQNTTVRTAAIHEFRARENTLLIEDIPGSITFFQLFTTFSLRSYFLGPSRSSLGLSLGAWLGTFHSSTLDRTDLPRIVASNETVRRLIWEYNERNLRQNIEAYPDVLKTDEPRVRAAVEAELKRTDGGDTGITHGDFHVMNVLLSSGLFSSTIVPVDWESCHFGCQTLDVAQMISNLYVVDRLGGINGPRNVMHGFIDGYHETRRLDKDLVWHTVVCVGVLILCTPYTMVLPGRDVREILQAGEDFLMRGLAKDRGWLETSALGILLDKI
ncbi:phosphotransferase family protein [Aspergillus fijiensis CBS 313.89]|uniref:Aminoglycoside phosphotransferase domain-containing protein n=1 Tax=Aspergillus fijiensis CBS 313.89 TaxID=1448319 RepID=A0A8G1RVE2_9EURO|nr:uncharacterized protein BO72DRAFT_484388 [Aspergillus fijiensis CBS 313.89]RAK79663.1 hypothetical protein BO72DRAFT_484388 [Aspergillus fijiensis CBS 313.89]